MSDDIYPGGGEGDSPKPNITPNTVVENPDARRRWTDVLTVLLLFVAIASLFLGIFPEADGDSDIANRAVLFINSAVSIVAATYGLTVTRPNIPKF